MKIFLFGFLAVVSISASAAPKCSKKFDRICEGDRAIYGTNFTGAVHKVLNDDVAIFIPDSNSPTSHRIQTKELFKAVAQLEDLTVGMSVLRGSQVYTVDEIFVNRRVSLSAIGAGWSSNPVVDLRDYEIVNP